MALVNPANEKVYHVFKGHIDAMIKGNRMLNLMNEPFVIFSPPLG